MRLLLAILCTLLLATPPGHSQSLPLDNQRKVSFYEVVQADLRRAGTLYAHAMHWLHRYGYSRRAANSVAERLVATQAVAMYDRGCTYQKTALLVPHRPTVTTRPAPSANWLAAFS